MYKKTAIEEQLANESQLSLLQKIVRMIDRKAPRLDDVGKHTISKLADKADMNVPEEDIFEFMDRASEKITNELVNLVADVNNENVILRGAALGLTAGIGAVLLPGDQLFESAGKKTAKDKLLTVGMYVVSGILASLITKQLYKKDNPTSNFN